jgi:hypothetical protein
MYTIHSDFSPYRNVSAKEPADIMEENTPKYKGSRGGAVSPG